LQTNTCAALHAGVHGTPTALLIIPYKNPLERLSMRRFLDRSLLPDQVMKASVLMQRGTKKPIGPRCFNPIGW
jgi:hypothetical protein